MSRSKHGEVKEAESKVSTVAADAGQESAVRGSKAEIEGSAKSTPEIGDKVFYRKADRVCVGWVIDERKDGFTVSILDPNMPNRCEAHANCKFGTDKGQFHFDRELMKAAAGYDRYVAPVLK